MGVDAFFSLTNGAKFDKKRFQEDVNVFIV